MPLAVVCASHSPLMYRGPASDETEGRVKAAFAELARSSGTTAPTSSSSSRRITSTVSSTT